MIHGVFGKLGSGKGLLVMDIIARELIDGFRDIVTNVPVRIVPWVNGQGLPQIGLRAYLLEKLHPLSDDEVDEILKRVRVNEDIDQGADLFLWRRDSETNEWFKLDITKVDEKGRPERFAAAQIKERHCAPILCVTDEAWQFYPNNGGFSRAPILPFYARQQRKLRDEWYIVTQHPTDVDATFWNIAQDFWVCRNHGMERMGIFRQPKMFRVIVYLTNPAKGNAIRSHENYRFLDKKLSQCYDTTAGVGITGGFAGDANQKSRGIHMGWLAAGLLLLMLFLMFLPHYMGKGASAWIRHSIAKPSSPQAWSGIGQTNLPQSGMPANQPPNKGIPASEAANSVSSSTVQTGASDLPPVAMSGYFKLGDKYIVTLTDGSTYETGDPDLKLLAKTYCIIGTNTYRIQRRDPRTIAVTPLYSFDNQLQPQPLSGQYQSPALQSETEYVPRPALVYTIPNRSPLDAATGGYRGHLQDISSPFQNQTTSQNHVQIQ